MFFMGSKSKTTLSTEQQFLTAFSPITASNGTRTQQINTKERERRKSSDSQNRSSPASIKQNFSKKSFSHHFSFPLNGNCGCSKHHTITNLIKITVIGHNSRFYSPGI